MAKRYRDPIEVTCGHGSKPEAFSWRGRTYRVSSVLGHWREDAGYWWGSGVQIPQRDLWRVEARNGKPVPGVYELVREDGGWRLNRVWD